MSQRAIDNSNDSNVANSPKLYNNSAVPIDAKDGPLYAPLTGSQPNVTNGTTPPPADDDPPWEPEYAEAEPGVGPNGLRLVRRQKAITRLGNSLRKLPHLLTSKLRRDKDSSDGEGETTGTDETSSSEISPTGVEATSSPKTTPKGLQRMSSASSSVRGTPKQPIKGILKRNSSKTSVHSLQPTESNESLNTVGDVNRFGGADSMNSMNRGGARSLGDPESVPESHESIEIQPLHQIPSTGKLIGNSARPLNKTRIGFAGSVPSNLARLGDEEIIKNSKSASAADLLNPPGTPIGSNASTPGSRRSIKFSQRVLVGETHMSQEYERQGQFIARSLTPELAMSIKEELNKFKAEMDVHEESQQNTQFYK